MKTLIKFMIILITNSIVCFGQAPPIAWQKSYGSTMSDYGESIQPTSDGGYITIGVSGANDNDASGNKGFDDVWVIKLDNIGNIQWQKNFGGTDYDQGLDIHQTLDGGYIFLALTRSNDLDVSGNHSLVGQSDYWVVKLSNTGAIQWKKCYGGSSWEGYNQGGKMILTKDGGYCFAGSSRSNDGDVSGKHGQEDVWVVKLDIVGNIQWQKCYGSNDNDSGYDITETTDGGYIVCSVNGSNISGDVTQIYGAGDAWLIKINSSGLIQWQKTYGGPNLERAHKVRQTVDKGYIFCSWTGANGNDVIGYKGGNNDYWIVRTDSNGVIKWAKCFGGTGGDIPHGLGTTNDGGYVIVGNSYSLDGDITSNIYADDMWVIKIDDFGNIVWQKNYGGNVSDYGLYIIQTSDNGFIISGWSSSTNGDVTSNKGYQDMWIVKLNPFTGIDEIPVLNGQYSLYPNPSSTLLYIKNTNNIKIDALIVLDIVGRKVLEQKETSQINIQSLVPGIYNLVINSEGISHSYKFIKE